MTQPAHPDPAVVPARIRALTPKERRFVEEYPLDFNATAAAKRAGYRGKNNAVLRTLAGRLLRKLHIQAALSERMDRLTDGADEQTRKIIQETICLAFSDIRKLFNEDGTLKDLTQLDKDTAACLASVEVYEEYSGSGEDRKHVGCTKKVKLWDKNAALDKLFRFLALYKDPGSKGNSLNVKHSGEIKGERFANADPVLLVQIALEHKEEKKQQEASAQ